MSDRPSPSSRWLTWLTLLSILLITALASSDLAAVPFHPDESTQLFMSQDLELLLTQPQALFWRSEVQTDLRQRYRTLDPPLTRYLLGAARLLRGLPPLPEDWDWSLSWAENEQRGALPAADLLLTGRFAVTLCLPFSLWLIARTASALGGSISGWLAAILLGLNALVLLHTRRAMAEAALLMGTCLTMWSLLSANRRPWLVGLAAALAFNAKYSTFPLAAIGLLAVLWEAKPPDRLRSALLYLLVFAILTLSLNPFLWGQPMPALSAAWHNRQELLARQVASTTILAPEQVLDTPWERLGVLLLNLYLMPPAFAEVGNYLEQTAAAEAAYRLVPWHNLFRGLAGGAMLLTLGILGLIFTLREHSRMSPQRRHLSALLTLATLAQAAGLIATIPLPWQRYVIPMVPFSILWAAIGLGFLLKLIPGRRTFSGAAV